MTPINPGCASPTREQMKAEIERLRAALRFYAKGWHVEGLPCLSIKDDVWSSKASGPDWWVHLPTAVEIEAGRTATLALRNLYIDWSRRGGEPAAIRGEK